MLLKAGCKPSLSFFMNCRSGDEMEQNGMGEHSKQGVLKQWCHSSNRHDDRRGDRERGVWHVTFPGHPDCPGTLIRYQIQTYTHRHVMAITLLSVVNNSVRFVGITDIQLRPSCTNLTLISYTATNNWSKCICDKLVYGRRNSAEISKHLSRNQWPGMVNTVTIPGDWVLGGRKHPGEVTSPSLGWHGHVHTDKN